MKEFKIQTPQIIIPWKSPKKDLNKMPGIQIFSHNKNIYNKLEKRAKLIKKI
jgi:hypothetical protein